MLESKRYGVYTAEQWAVRGLWWPSAATYLARDLIAAQKRIAKLECDINLAQHQLINAEREEAEAVDGWNNALAKLAHANRVIAKMHKPKEDKP